MKVRVIIECGDNRIVVNVSCGAGDKTIRWLASTCTQLYSEQVPSQLLISRIEIAGRALHPTSIISAVLQHNDEVKVSLYENIELDACGTPILSDWAQLAYTENIGASLDESKDDKDTPVESREAIRSKIEFVRTTMKQQTLNWSAIEHKVTSVWPDIISYFRLSEEDAARLKDLCVKNIILFEELHHDCIAKGPLTLPVFQQFVDEANIFPKKISATLATRAFHFATKESTNELSVSRFVVALVAISQSRHNDTFEKSRTLARPVEGFALLLDTNIRPLAAKRLAECLVREALSSDEFLYKLYFLRKDLFVLFEKAERTDYSSLPLHLLHALLVDLKLITDANDAHFKTCKRLALLIKSGDIYGRSLASADFISSTPSALAADGEDVFLFPEFIEAICRAAYMKAIDDNTVHKMHLTDIFLSGLNKAVQSLVAKVNPADAKKKK